MDNQGKGTRRLFRATVAILAALVGASLTGACSASPTPVFITPRPTTTATRAPLPTLAPTYTRVPTATPCPTPTNTPTPSVTPTQKPSPIPSGPGAPVPPTPACPAPTSYSDLWGRIIFWSDRNGRPALFVMDSEGNDQQPLLPDRPDCAQAVYKYFHDRLTLSGNGEWRLTVEQSGKDVNIFIRTVDGKLLRRLTSHTATDYSPAWSPDNHSVAFVSQVDGNDEIYVIDADGRQERRLTFNSWEWDKHPSWSPDGRFIVFYSNREVGRQQIWVMEANGRNQHNLSRNAYNDWDPVWVNF